MRNQRSLDSSLVTSIRVLRIFFNIAKRSSPRVLSIGDSHAVHFYKYLLDTIPNNQNVLCWLGPRLMYSVAKRGFCLTRLQEIALKVWKPQYCFIWLGEIDVRMHLVKQGYSTKADLVWLENFIIQLEVFWLQLGKPNLILFSPVPQISDSIFASEYPAYGSFHNRVEAQNALILQLQSLASKVSFPLNFIEITTTLQDTNGHLLPAYSDDSCHLNFFGFKTIDVLWKNFLIM